MSFKTLNEDFDTFCMSKDSLPHNTVQCLIRKYKLHKFCNKNNSKSTS